MQIYRCLYNTPTQAADIHYCSSCTGPVIGVLQNISWVGTCAAWLLPKNWAAGLNPRQARARPAILKNKSSAKPQYIEALSSFLPAPTLQWCCSWVCQHSTPMPEDRAWPNDQKQPPKSSWYNQGIYFKLKSWDRDRQQAGHNLFPSLNLSLTREQISPWCKSAKLLCLERTIVIDPAWRPAQKVLEVSCNSLETCDIESRHLSSTVL